jgi:hypothetical protein
MNEIEGTAAMVALFTLRCIAPLAITLGMGYLMNRLVDRWQAEELAKKTQDPQPVPEIEPSLGTQRALPSVKLPCWISKNCSEEMQENCVARKQPGLPCWLVRLRYEGVLPKDCPDCPIYEENTAIAMGD